MTRGQWIATAATGTLGAGLLIFGIVFGTTIFDRYEKVPTDLDRTVDLIGTYTVVDTAFTDQLSDNQTIAGLLASGKLAEVQSDPAVAGLLANPALGKLIQNPGLLAVIADPDSLKLLANPALAALMGDPVVLGALADPAVIGGLADPSKLAALAAANPALAAVLGDESVLGILTNPSFATLLSSGALTTLIASPDLVGLLTDPAIAAALANPVLGALLADPAAIAILLDPRTQTLLANPADLPTLDASVNIHRVREGLRKEGSRLFIREQVTTTNLASGEGMPGFPPTDLTLVVDRSSKVYLEGTEGGRTGQWGLPFHPDKKTAYSSWISAASQPFDAVFVDEEKVLGVNTYKYVVSVSDAPMGVNDPATDFPLVFDTETTVWVEPNTGAGVDAVVKDTVSALAPDGRKYVRFANDLEYSDPSVLGLVNEVDGHRDNIYGYGTILPWSAGIVGGVILAMAMMTGFLLTKAGRRALDRQGTRPTPTKMKTR